MESQNACETTDNGNDGCGFINEAYLEHLLGDKKYAQDTLSIQIRFVSPRLGIFKGMLMRKRHTGGSPIELQPSMKKVLSSPTNGSSLVACLVITQAGRHPTPINSYIGRMLNPNLKDPPEKSFEALIKPLNKKPLADNVDMIPRLFQGVGVPRNLCDSYVIESKRKSRLCHAYVVGVADPTNSLPPGHVFVPGFASVSTPNNKLFVTRSPSVKAPDPKMVPMVTSKPPAMSQEDWDLLLALPFGAVIFANPKKGTHPLPAQIASGDLDGDLYFICWNSELLQHITTDPLEEVFLEEEGEEEKIGTRVHSCDNWLTEAQNMMIDLTAVEELGALTGQLYRLSQKAADNSQFFMRDRDAVAFGNAFNKALEYQKHGGKIQLPAHLHCQVKPYFQKYLC